MTKTKTAVPKPRPWDGSADSAVASFGSWLRLQRESRGVSLREVADASRISLRYLEALENDRFDALPAPVFARGFLREYARIVGLDGDEVVNAFLVAAEKPEAEPPEEVPRRGRHAPTAWGFGLILGLAMAALLALAVALSFWAERRRTAEPPRASMVPPATVAEPKPSELPVATPTVETPVTEAAPSDGTTVPPAAPSAAPLVVGLSFSEACWLEASVDGRRRPGELRIAGEVLTLPAQEAVVLTLGNRRGVTVSVNGQPFALPAAPGNVVRGLRIARPAPPGPTPEPGR